ncbi:hypothetical protein GM51_8890 [freshwater metagenome]|uniref:Uncharacterized protein n=1 Tax=freshwater metagenome TaxID=449393 RepID=A0A094SIH0_9ZZZZ
MSAQRVSPPKRELREAETVQVFLKDTSRAHEQFLGLGNYDN